MSDLCTLYLNFRFVHTGVRINTLQTKNSGVTGDKMVKLLIWLQSLVYRVYTMNKVARLTVGLVYPYFSGHFIICLISKTILLYISIPGHGIKLCIDLQQSLILENRRVGLYAMLFPTVLVMRVGHAVWFGAGRLDFVNIVLLLCRIRLTLQL